MLARRSRSVLTKVETFDWLMNVNTKAPMIVAQECARDMIRRSHKGAIVNVSSMAAFQGCAGASVYCATKALDDVACHGGGVGARGIRVNCVNPV